MFGQAADPPGIMETHPAHRERLMQTASRNSLQDAALLAILNHPRRAFWLSLSLALSVALGFGFAFLLGAGFLICQIGLNGAAVWAAGTLISPRPDQRDIGGVAQMLFSASVSFSALACDFLMR